MEFLLNASYCHRNRIGWIFRELPLSLPPLDRPNGSCLLDPHKNTGWAAALPEIESQPFCCEAVCPPASCLMPRVSIFPLVK